MHSTSVCDRPLQTRAIVLALPRHVFPIDDSCSAVKLARDAWLRVAGMLLLALLAATALGFYGYQIHRLDGALNSYKEAVQLYQMRTEAIHRLSDMEAAFNRYLLDGNSANLGLIQADKQRIEQLAQWDADAQHDQILQNLVAAEQKWHGQIVQPIIEERRKVPAGQGLPEDFLAKYRASPQDLQLINFESDRGKCVPSGAAGLAANRESVALALAAVPAGGIARDMPDCTERERVQEREPSETGGGE